MKNLKYIYAFIFTVALTGCSDFLDQVPDTRVDLTTTEHARQLMNTAYPTYNYGWACEIMSDNIIDNNSPDENGVRFNLSSYDIGDEEMYRWEQNRSNSGLDSPSMIWQGYYLSIANANATLELLNRLKANQGGILDETQSAIRGEALLLRAYAHFTLATVFCEPYRGPELGRLQPGIPYITEPETTVKPHYDRSNLTETFAKIEADLEAGIPLINNSIYEVPKYHFNKAAAHAFAARFYLTCRNYPAVIRHADEAFGGADVDAEPFMSEIWSAPLYSPIDYSYFNQSISNPRNFMLMATYSMAMRRLAGYRFALNRDAQTATLNTPGPTWDHRKFMYLGNSGKPFYQNVCFSRGQYFSGRSEYGYFWPGNVCEHFEYSNKVSGIGYAHVTRSEFTAEETLLCRAEAKLFTGDIKGAVEDLGKWERPHRNNVFQLSSKTSYYLDWSEANIRRFYTQKVGVEGSTLIDGIVREFHIDEVFPCEYTLTDNMKPILNCIQHFRRIEFVHTGMRWFDIKRYGFEIDHKYGKDDILHLDVLDPRKAMQIPPEVVSAGLIPNEHTKAVFSQNDPSTLITIDRQ